MSDIVEDAGLLAIGQAVEFSVVSAIWGVSWLLANSPNERFELAARHFRMSVFCSIPSAVVVLKICLPRQKHATIVAGMGMMKCTRWTLDKGIPAHVHALLLSAGW